MSSLEVIGWGAVSPAGVGVKAMEGEWTSGSTADAESAELRGLYPEQLPPSHGRALASFDVRAQLGRKGTSFLDRRCALALVACGEALRDGGISIDDSNRHRAGIVLGTTWGSFKSMSDSTRDTLVEKPPYLVSAAQFPNTVMNCAAGQAAIWYGMKGVNATVAGGQMAFLNVLRYVRNAFCSNRVDILLAGAVEEFTPHTAWATELLNRNGRPAVAGEGAVVFAVRRSGDEWQHAPQILSVVTGFAPHTDSGKPIGKALECCIRRALDKAKVDPGQVSLVAGNATPGHDEEIEDEALCAVFHRTMDRILPKAAFGECYAASSAFQMAAIMIRARSQPAEAPRFALLTGWTPDGGVGAALIRS